MKRETVEIFENNDYTISINSIGDDVIVGDKEEHSYYKISRDKFNDIFKNEKFDFNIEMEDNILWFVWICLFIIAVLFFYSFRIKYKIIDENFILATAILLVNIPIHEAGHILALKFFYRKSKIKVGFKFVFIYPAFYVDTSESYLLPKYNRIVVYLAGNLMNCIFLLIIMLFFPYYLKSCYILFSNILINFLPIIKSDGYYALMCLCNRTGYFRSDKREFVEDFIRGLCMFLLLYVLQKIRAYV